MVPAVKRQIDVNRLRADIAAASVELLAAHCASDRVRLQYSPQDIVAFGDPQALKRAIASAESLHNFFSQVAVQIKEQKNTTEEDR
jgi:hypothetical protein